MSGWLSRALAAGAFPVLGLKPDEPRAVALRNHNSRRGSGAQTDGRGKSAPTLAPPARPVTGNLRWGFPGRDWSFVAAACCFAFWEYACCACCWGISGSSREPETFVEGARLRHLPLQGGYSDRIAQAVEKLRKEFDRPLRVESLAKEMGMSPSGFHHHFKTVTDMSPLQFQRQIRPQEARRLMLGENLDASSAGYRVGYEDPSHFSRDYKRLFGHSPARDADRLRAMVAAD